jgi:hypothetical protein
VASLSLPLSWSSPQKGWNGQAQDSRQEVQLDTWILEDLRDEYIGKEESNESNKTVEYENSKEKNEAVNNAAVDSDESEEDWTDDVVRPQVNWTIMRDIKAGNLRRRYQ